MISRHLIKEVIQGLDGMPAVALMGPRQVGKTTLAMEVAQARPSVYLDLEDRIDLQKVENIKEFHQANRDKLIILDEVQRAPEIFAQIRGIIDQQRREGNRSGQFLFLGSASIELLRQSSETLAGRITYEELFPLDVIEWLETYPGDDSLRQLWLRGGFPDSVLSVDDSSSLRWRQDFIRTYLERDIPQLGPRIPASTLERFWVMLAHDQGGTMNASKIAANLNVSSVTIGRYTDLFVDLLLVRKLQPYSPNVKKRVVKSPRLYVRDSGITHALLNVGSYNDLLGHPVVGKSWEGFVIENIAAYLPPQARLYYYRTARGAEIDLLIEFSLDEIWAIEIKRGTQATPSKGFYEACEDIGPTRKYVVHAGTDRFPLQHEIEAVPLDQLIRQVQSR